MSILLLLRVNIQSDKSQNIFKRFYKYQQQQQSIDRGKILSTNNMRNSLPNQMSFCLNLFIYLFIYFFIDS